MAHCPLPSARIPDTMTSAAAVLLRRRALLVVGLVVTYWGAGSCGLPAYGKIAHPGADAAVAATNIHDVRGVFSWDTLPVSFHGGNLSNQYSDESIQQLSRYRQPKILTEHIASQPETRHVPLIPPVSPPVQTREKGRVSSAKLRVGELVYV